MKGSTPKMNTDRIFHRYMFWILLILAAGCREENRSELSDKNPVEVLQEKDGIIFEYGTDSVLDGFITWKTGQMNGPAVFFNEYMDVVEILNYRRNLLANARIEFHLNRIPSVVETFHNDQGAGQAVFYYDNGVTE